MRRACSLPVPLATRGLVQLERQFRGNWSPVFVPAAC